MPSSVLKRTLNTMLNPLSDDILDPGFSIGGDREMARQVARAGALMATYGLGAYGVKSLLNSSQKTEDAKRRARLKAHLNARYPIISLDSSTRDVRTEEKERERGLSKAAFFEGEQNLPPMYALALSAAALVAGASGGARLADISHAAEDKREQQEELKKKRNTYDKELMAEYRATRGLDKAARFRFETTGRPPERGQGGGGTPSGKTVMDQLKGALHTVGQGYGVWVVASMLAAYHVGKKKFDEIDPNRQRIKDIEQVSKERSRSGRAPVFLDESEMPDEEGVKLTGSNKNVSSVKLPGKRKPESDLL
jgi:hypothetical protein